jgi:hypothetical protein
MERRVSQAVDGLQLISLHPLAKKLGISHISPRTWIEEVRFPACRGIVGSTDHTRGFKSDGGPHPGRGKYFATLRTDSRAMRVSNDRVLECVDRTSRRR